MSIARQQKRFREKVAQQRYKQTAGALRQVELQDREHPAWITRCFSNNRYVVMIDDKAKTDKGIAILAMIQMHGDTPIPNHWRELQNIKNELFGPETIGVEFFPAESQLVDAHNIYWLWIFDDGVLPNVKVQ
jgi:hypothetical protein